MSTASPIFLQPASSSAYVTPPTKQENNSQQQQRTSMIISPNLKSALSSDPTAFGLTRRSLFCPDSLADEIMREAEQRIGCTMRAPFENADHQCCELNFHQAVDEQFAQLCVSVLANTNQNATDNTILPYLQHIDRFYRSVHHAENENFKTIRCQYMTNPMIENVLNNLIAVLRATNWIACRRLGRLGVRLMPHMTKNDLMQMTWQAKVLLGQFINHLNIAAYGYSTCISTKFVELLGAVKWDQVVTGRAKNNHVVIIGYPINTLHDRERQVCLAMKLAIHILQGDAYRIGRYIYLERCNNPALPISQLMTNGLIQTAHQMSQHCRNAVFELQHVCLQQNMTFENYRLQFMLRVQILTPTLVLQMQNTILVTLNAERSQIVTFIQLHYYDECIILSVLNHGYENVLPTNTDNM